jgi:hypothetical protein
MLARWCASMAHFITIEVNRVFQIIGRWFGTFCLFALAIVGCDRQSRESGASATAAARAAPRIELHSSDDATPAWIEVNGLSADELEAFETLDETERGDVLQVTVISDLAQPPSVLGTTSIEDHVLRFTPRFGLEPGLGYRAVLHRGVLRPSPDLASDDIKAEFQIAARIVGEPTKVTQIYPSADKLPENQLKFYLHFSAPMSRGEAYRHIHLLDDKGQEVDAAFLELGEELWDREMVRFTLLCDPGRVKRGLKPREELGPVLLEGHDYTLVIDGDWRDAVGNPLAEPARKAFHVLAPDDTPIDPTTWKIETPTSLGRDGLVVRFGESLDHSLLERVLEVQSRSGAKVEGKVDVSENETCWRFFPSHRWIAGEYRLVAQTTLEDLAGNSIGKPFEVDELRPIEQTIRTDTVSIPFTIAPADGK